MFELMHHCDESESGAKAYIVMCFCCCCWDYTSICDVSQKCLSRWCTRYYIMLLDNNVLYALCHILYALCH